MNSLIFWPYTLAISKKNHFPLFELIKDEAAPKVHIVHSNLGAEVVYVQDDYGAIGTITNFKLFYLMHPLAFSYFFMSI
jgi:hypothetical protein